MKKHIAIFLLLFSVFLFGQEKNINVELGIPYDSNPSDDYLIYRTQYVLSFNPNLYVANWVSWNLNNNWLGNIKRKDTFSPDPDLPSNIYQATKEDYEGYEKYDRGHTIPNDDRSASREDANTTFYYTNMMPQHYSFNRGVWKSFELYCRKLCIEKDKELYVISGGIYHVGHKTIGNDVAVPDSCFKIVVILNNGEKLSDVTSSTEIIAVVMPNDRSVKGKKWTKYITTIKRIEWSTGYKFLSDVPDNIREILEIEEYNK